ncbi:MAG TPA: CHRD domain-containing protein [Rhizomicrobium sp.]|jgi:hypothetical protein|nr:CHRD domain-containing protein [Rhizomicrobium sp.]
MTARHILVAALAVLLVAPARAESVSLVAHLLGGNNIPANKSDAFGEAQFTYDTAARLLDYYVTYDGIAPSKIDLHGPAAANESGAMAANIPVSENPVTGKLTLTPDQGAALLAGRMYVDIHSQAFANGEIRGQIGEH